MHEYLGVRAGISSRKSVGSPWLAMCNQGHNINVTIRTLLKMEHAELLYESNRPSNVTSPARTRRICKNRVRIMLIRHGLSYAEVARRLNVTNRSTIARVVYGHYVLPEIREGIAGLLGVPADRLWPTDRAA